MNDAKYIGLDVHQATISVAFLPPSPSEVQERIHRPPIPRLESESTEFRHRRKAGPQVLLRAARLCQVPLS